MQRALLVPELLVADLAASLRFWCGLCGFRIAYDRPEDRFAYLDRDGAQVMLEEAAGPERRWLTGAMEKPFGRGINFQITVAQVDPILAKLEAAGWPLYLDVEETWYRVDDGEIGVRQFLVQDPDGYLLRFSQALQADSPATQPLDQAH
ncbi:VOC family protein [Roseomonas frigidaquae]|uniref:Bleomycin resistance protein n=1 Tax=Falsiroseomonas frigidaquae TaxID=487318 RepID=A0ABX1F2U0_9PROT|nr:VOC family protein [Falsiroseomonas frigidaquae]NKE46653.1 VOC family protein [Falsiroseomonas frigidaquae]